MDEEKQKLAMVLISLVVLIAVVAVFFSGGGLGHLMEFGSHE